MQKEIYCDYAATTPLDPEVKKKMLPYFGENFGNASSLHTRGQKAHKVLDEARARVAKVLHCLPEEIIFLSGGTEADNLALFGYLTNFRSGTLITTEIEHHAITHAIPILRKQEGYKVIELGVDSDGVVDFDRLKKLIKKRDVRMVSVMYANNEVGTIQPIAEIGKLCRERGVCFHVDAVQAGGTLDLNVQKLNCDLLSLSGHKFYGPQGVGVLYRRKEIKLLPRIVGGSQEMHMRASTENLAGIVGFSFALEKADKAKEKEGKRLKKMRDDFVKQVLKAIPDTKYNGHKTKRLPNNAHFCFAGVEGESILMRLDQEGIRVSTASACSSDSLEPSHVLAAMHIPLVIAHGSCRFSFGKYTTASDIKFILKVLPKIIVELREMSPVYREGMLAEFMRKAKKAHKGLFRGKK